MRAGERFAALRGRAARRAGAGVDLERDARGAAADRHGRGRPAAAPGGDRRAPRADGGAGTAASGCPSAPTRRGSTRCSWRRARARCASTSRTSSAGAAPRSSSRCARTPGRRSCRSTGRSSSSSGPTGGYPSGGAYRAYHRRSPRDHHPWAVDGSPYDAERGRAQALADARDFVGAGRPAHRRRRALRLRDRHGAARPLVVRGARVARGGRASVRGARRPAGPARRGGGGHVARGPAPRRRPRHHDVGDPAGPLDLGPARGRRARLAAARGGARAPRRGPGRASAGGPRAPRAAELGLGVPAHPRAQRGVPARAGRGAPRGDAGGAG